MQVQAVEWRSCMDGATILGAEMQAPRVVTALRYKARHMIDKRVCMYSCKMDSKRSESGEPS